MNKTNKLSVFYKIKLWWKFKAQFFHTDFIRGVKNIFKWLPIVWKDRDWDDSYITEILIKKLEFTRDFYLSGKAYSAEAEKIADEIKEAIDRLHMTRDSWEFYEQPPHDIIEEKWGKSDFKWIPTNDGTGSMYMEIEHENVKTPEDKEQYSEDLREAMKTTRKEYEKDKIKAYKFIAKHIDSWWD
jgi:hypothetical protein